MQARSSAWWRRSASRLPSRSAPSTRRLHSIGVKRARPGVRCDRGLARITWIGHSTVLLELDGVSLLTDPLLRRRVMQLRRVAAPAAAPERIHAVLVSHAHYDPLDVTSLTRVDPAAR